MEDTIVTTYYLRDEFLKAVGHRDDQQVCLSTAEVMTIPLAIPLVAAAFFGGNIEKSRSFLVEYGYMKKMISRSRLNRKLHAIDPSYWEALFALLAEVFKERRSDESSERSSERNYVVDSLPIAREPLRQHPHQAVSYLSSTRAWADVPRLHSEQAPLLLRFAGAFGGKR